MYVVSDLSMPLLDLPAIKSLQLIQPIDIEQAAEEEFVKGYLTVLKGS